MAQHLVLCVDDYPAGLDTIRIVLENAGFDVRCAADEVAAMDLAGTTKFDAVVLDFQMPHMNGATLARQLKQRQPYLPVLLISAYPADIPEDAVESVDCFLCKGHQTARELPAAVKCLVETKVLSRQETADRLRSAARDALKIDEEFAIRLESEN